MWLFFDCLTAFVAQQLVPIASTNNFGVVIDPPKIVCASMHGLLWAKMSVGAPRNPSKLF
jgi:hypothetical protein